ncbi:hypothetical protein [Pyxidicoccus caerfyrddinensis]|uniref:hypothetical protein n=1 Tax=Pyxidicoccus caerfyrddinensis TaxID=2709663 RepID=UPI001966F68F|nr:hypothetical protein [Pyxidicoccus caerfyrddinensis]
MTLTAVGGSNPYRWTESSDGTLLNSETAETQIAWRVSGRAFGRTSIEVSDGSGGSEILALYVGSVVIVGADGSHCQVFADGSAKRIDPDEVDPRITALVDSNAIVADITGQAKAVAPSSEAVTCYVLNLASFAFDSSKKSKKNR